MKIQKRIVEILNLVDKARKDAEKERMFELEDLLRKIDIKINELGLVIVTPPGRKHTICGERYKELIVDEEVRNERTR